MATSGRGDPESERATLTDILLRLPRHPARMERYDFLATLEVQPQAEEWLKAPPVAAVGIDHDDGSLVVFTAEKGVVDLQGLADRFHILTPVREIYSGPILPAQRQRPAQGGDSISGDAPGGDTGTICCLVENDVGDQFLLGCNHTLAGVNRAAVNQDIVCQPGAADGGVAPGDGVGVLANYATIALGGYHRNVMDAAIAEVQSAADADAGVRDLGKISGVSAPISHHARVQKRGRTTGHTFGTYQFTMDFTTDFHGSPALFVGHYGVVGDDPAVGFAQQGDSGAPVLLEDEMDLAGMVIGVAAGINVTLVTPIGLILDHFKVEPVL